MSKVVLFSKWGLPLDLLGSLFQVCSTLKDFGRVTGWG